jgi:crotonobetaine/carnitine-CoA ligase
VRWGTAVRDTIPAALARTVEASGDRPFLVVDGRVLTYAEVDRATTRLANELGAQGLAPGDRLASLMSNSADLVIVMLATLKAGAVWVPINTAFSGTFLTHPLVDSGAKVVVADGEFLSAVLDVLSELRDLELVLVRDAGESANKMVQATDRPLLASLDEHRGEDETPVAIEVRPPDLGALMYTSGTTGPAKACMMSHNYLCQIGHRGNALVDLRHGETVWTCLPMFHASALQAVIGAILVQGPAAISPRFSRSGFWGEIEQSGARVAKIMASMVPLLATAPDNEAMLRCRGQLRAIVGNPFTDEQKRVFHERFGVDYVACNQFAMTEGYCVTSVPYGTVAPQGSAGRRNDDFDVILVDDDDREVEPGEPGELLFRPRQPMGMFDGYWRRQEETHEGTRGLWMHTGDIGRFDEDGYFYFVDRKKDYIRRRGENVSSWEMEKVVDGHPAVKEVACHAVSSELSEDDIKLTIVPIPGEMPDPAEVLSWVDERVPSFARPRYIEFRDELPKNGVGRVLKVRLRAEGRTAGTWERPGVVR